MANNIAYSKDVSINKTEREQIKADVKTDIENAALLSKDHVLQSAASTSSADSDLVNAMDIASSILF